MFDLRLSVSEYSQQQEQLDHESRNTMSISHLVLQLLLALCAATSSYGRPVQMTLQHRILSRVTGHYLAITKSGRVHANGDINTENPGK